MKWYLKVFLFLESIVIYSGEPSWRLLEQDTLSRPLIALLSRVGIAYDKGLDHIVTQTQQLWLRPAGIELFELSEMQPMLRQEVDPLLKELGMGERVWPMKMYHDYCLVLGSELESFRERLAYVALLWDAGIRFSELIFLSGARILDSRHENEAAIMNFSQNVLPLNNDTCYKKLLQTESEMVAFLYQHSKIPQALRQIPYSIVDTPQKFMPDGTKKRPNTEDTVREWLSKGGETGTCLAISSQPFVGYQHSILSALLPDCETVGNALFVDEEPLSVYLDTLARWLCQERKRLHPEYR